MLFPVKLKITFIHSFRERFSPQTEKKAPFWKNLIFRIYQKLRSSLRNQKSNDGDNTLDFSLLFPIPHRWN
jgi:hypothetical protein